MSKALSLKLEDEIFEETEKLIKKIRIPRNAYINRALHFYNHCQRRLLVKKKLQNDIALLKNETEQFVREFELLEDLPE